MSEFGIEGKALPSLVMMNTQGFFDLAHKSKAPVPAALGRRHNLRC